jgi:uncharacterized protein YjbI with pentapeptide repeats
MQSNNTALIRTLVAAGLCLGLWAAGQSLAQTSAPDSKAAAGRSFRGQKLQKAAFAKADLRNADFSDAILDGADFTEAQLQGANFSGASLREANFLNARADGANFSKAMADGASLTQANLPNANFAGASLRGASFGNGDTDGINFTGANLESADLNSLWRGVNFTKANLRGAVFGFGVPTYLEGANLSDATLEGVIFEGVFLTGADLRGAKLADALFGAVAQSSDLQGANLEGAELQGADLGGVDFSGASLVHAQLWRTQNKPMLNLTDTTAVNLKTLPKLDMVALQRAIVGNPRKDDVALRLQMANPAKPAPKDLTPANVWTGKAPATKDLAGFLAELACKAPEQNFDRPPQPYVARGLLNNGRLLATGSDVVIVATKMRACKTNTAACPGVIGFTDKDWALLDDTVAKAGVAPK